ncbi:MAG: DNA primase [Bifidobacteriaceae bacterium]|jgi:DNA primase|nr:DNA primase [Bifidobacteriaceae bacterium]
MAQIISHNDIAELRNSANILEILGKQITLKPAGIGRYKGLCPFHDEKTPSFTISPHMNSWHCFGCGEHGDIYAFFMKLNSMNFPEAVEYVASLSGFQLHYKTIKNTNSESAEGVVTSTASRQKLYKINQKAASAFAKALFSPSGERVRKILYERKFNDNDIKNFSIGYAPQNSLTKYLQDRGFTNNELIDSGISAEHNNILTDRFQNRIIWPIFDLTDQVVGFGGRILENNSKLAKYLNTKETKLYKKSQILYGINSARKSIAKHKQAIIVEGYTDVMAMHIAGFHNTVGTCGTAFGNSHAKLLRRIMADWGTGIGQNFPNANIGEVIFIFDGDQAGQKAAQKSFNEDQTFSAQTSVAIVPEGLDPCELRIKKGDKAIQQLVNSAIPLFEYVIKSSIKDIKLDRPERRLTALKIAAPIIAKIKDRGLRVQYTELAANWLRLKYEIVLNEIAKELKHKEKAPENINENFSLSISDLTLAAILQAPRQIPEKFYKMLNIGFYSSSAKQNIYNLITQAGGVEEAKKIGEKAFSQSVFQLAEKTNSPNKKYLSLLINKPLLYDKKGRFDLYIQDIFKQFFLKNLNYYISEYRAELKSISSSTAQKGQSEPKKEKLLTEILRLEKIRKSLQKN